MPTAKAPVRIDLAGGWSDAPPFCEQVGGDVVNIAINHYAHANLNVDESGKLRVEYTCCLLYTSPSPRDMRRSRMPSSA